jgi:hypothetical protein
MFCIFSKVRGLGTLEHPVNSEGRTMTTLICKVSGYHMSFAANWASPYITENFRTLRHKMAGYI